MEGTGKMGPPVEAEQGKGLGLTVWACLWLDMGK